MKKRLEALLQHALSQAIEGGALKSDSLPPLLFEVPKNPAFGDLASAIALGLARAERRAPRQIAETIHGFIADPDGLLAGVDVEGPGYLNFRFSLKFWGDTLADIGEHDGPLAFNDIGQGKKVQVEFVSANPTGPLTVGHGRNAVLGDAIARLLEATGHQVTREYYFNNAGRQMKLLGESVKARYLEQLGDTITFPEDGYQGEYIREIAGTLISEHSDRLRDEPAAGRFKDVAERAIFADIEQTLGRVGIHFDVYFNEDTLYKGGQIAAVLEALRARQLAFDRDGAVWLAGEALELDKDRVLVKSTGEPAYRLPDIAYHQDKLRRGFDLIIDVLGADHIAEHEEVKAAIKALGLPAEKIHSIIYQFVTLTRGGVQVKMSTRRAEYVTVDELLDEVGADVVRVFFLTRRADSHLEFDLDLAKKQSSDNPVFYVQYAHARIHSLFKQATAAGAKLAPAAASHLETLTAPEELAVMKLLARYSDTVEDAARGFEPHRVVFYLMELAGEFHRFYNSHRILTDDLARTAARLYLAHAVRKVLHSGLGLLGVHAPESM
ncbi:MAG: arginine--tRNA ligase [Deltaproteobacteria bacterium]|nr:arginine--tRNA ligase [Deltaproteobacteria bacterium]MBI3389583.1 arginine--tRNA ligase [Deltaproteobacteria bacterium]